MWFCFYHMIKREGDPPFGPYVAWKEKETCTRQRVSSPNLRRTQVDSEESADRSRVEFQSPGYNLMSMFRRFLARANLRMMVLEASCQTSLHPICRTGFVNFHRPCFQVYPSSSVKQSASDSTWAATVALPSAIVR